MRIQFAAMLLAVFGLLGALPAMAQDGSAEAQLREKLKATLLQLRTAETERATLQAEKAVLEGQVKDLTDKVTLMGKSLEAGSKDLADEKDRAQRIQGTLETKLVNSQEELRKYTKSLDKWKASHIEISDIAKKKEAERAKFEAKASDLERQSAQLRSQNIELFNTANEILERYRKFSFGEALSAREPFTGITRVKLQNLVQEYKDKLLDQSATPAKP